MKTTRVSRGGEYYYLHHNHLSICIDCDFRNTIDDNRYEIGNYFRTKEEAETMARKLRAILKGADVIEMPSEDVIKGKAIDIAQNICGDDYWRDCEEAVIRTTEWIKSKIVK